MAPELQSKTEYNYKYTSNVKCAAGSRQWNWRSGSCLLLLSTSSFFSNLTLSHHFSICISFSVICSIDGTTLSWSLLLLKVIQEYLFIYSITFSCFHSFIHSSRLKSDEILKLWTPFISVHYILIIYVWNLLWNVFLYDIIIRHISRPSCDLILCITPYPDEVRR